MKRTSFIAAIAAFILLIPSFAFANTEPAQTDVLMLDDGSYFETVIEDSECNALSSDSFKILEAASKTTKTKSKTTYFKNSAGKVMWYVKVTGTFTYGNGSAKCTKSVCTAESKNKTWKVSNKSASKSKNKASATATGTHYLNGAPVESLKRTVTLTCSPTGDFS